MWTHQRKINLRGMDTLCTILTILLINIHHFFNFLAELALKMGNFGPKNAHDLSEIKLWP